MRSSPSRSVTRDPAAIPLAHLTRSLSIMIPTDDYVKFFSFLRPIKTGMRRLASADHNCQPADDRDTVQSAYEYSCELGKLAAILVGCCSGQSLLTEAKIVRLKVTWYSFESRKDV